MHIRRTIFTAVALILFVLLSGGSPASAGRIMATPLADVPKAGDYKLFTSTLKESRSTDKTRINYRLDLGLTDRTELSVAVTDPEGRPSTTQINLQYAVGRETQSVPGISAGLWDAGHIGKFSGQKTGGSFFVVAGKSIKVSEDRPPVKLSIGAGTNRLEGIFGGAVLPVNKKLGVLVEYAPENSRLPGAGAVNAGVYYFPTSSSRVRVSSVGGNPMIDFFVSGSIR